MWNTNMCSSVTGHKEVIGMDWERVGSVAGVVLKSEWPAHASCGVSHERNARGGLYLPDGK